MARDIIQAEAARAEAEGDRDFDEACLLARLEEWDDSALEAMTSGLDSEDAGERRASRDALEEFESSLAECVPAVQAARSLVALAEQAGIALDRPCVTDAVAMLDSDDQEVLATERFQSIDRMADASLTDEINAVLEQVLADCVMSGPRD
ncbi:MAG: hypothetical protein AAGD33_20130 [Actinomycetota bacterium]